MLLIATLVATLVAIALVSILHQNLQLPAPADDVLREQIYTLLIILSPKLPSTSPSELTYLTHRSSAPQPLPSLVSSPATVALSVVVPAYNERKRLGVMLRDCIQFLEGPLGDAHDEPGSQLPADVVKGSYEVLIVDDGSKDGTAQVALELAKELEQEFGSKRGEVKVVTLERNRGKGGATRFVRGYAHKIHELRGN